MKRKLLPLRGFQFYLTWSQDDKKDHDQSRKIKKEGPSFKKKKKKKNRKKREGPQTALAGAEATLNALLSREG